MVERLCMYIYTSVTLFIYMNSINVAFDSTPMLIPRLLVHVCVRAICSILMSSCAWALSGDDAEILFFRNVF